MKRMLAACLIMLLAGIVSVPSADFDGDRRADISIFRPSTGLWAVRGVTRVYFGGMFDTPVADDYDGDGSTDIGIFRYATGLWAIRDVSRQYFGGTSDIPVTGGGGGGGGSGSSGPLTFDYVVKANDAADLVNALQGTSQSVFVPAGTYSVSQRINVSAGLKLIQGEGIGTIIKFAGSGHYLSIDSPNCLVDRIMVEGGGDHAASVGNFLVNADYVTVSNCWSRDSQYSGFDVAIGAANASFINCVAEAGWFAGFNNQSSAFSTRVTNCMVMGGSTRGPNYGFRNMTNLSSCYVDGNNGIIYSGFYRCEDLTGCRAVGCSNSGFSECSRLSACSSVGTPGTFYGFLSCNKLSSCYAENVGEEYVSCWKMDTDTCD